MNIMASQFTVDDDVLAIRFRMGFGIGKFSLEILLAECARYLAKLLEALGICVTFSFWSKLPGRFLVHFGSDCASC
jgi:hypothetical protein